VQRISDSLNQVGGDEAIFQRSSVFFHVFSDPKGQRMGHGIRLFLLKNKFYYELRKDAAVAIVSGKKPQMACHLLQIDYRRNLRSKSLCIK